MQTHTEDLNHPEMQSDGVTSVMCVNLQLEDLIGCSGATAFV